MSRKTLGACAAVLLAIVPVAVAGQANDLAPPKQTRDRLSEERMDQLASAPLAVVRRDGLPAGRVAFERLLARTRARRGAGSVAAADLLTAFGVGLYGLGFTTDDRQMKEASLLYLDAAVPAYRLAFGAAHPEVAVALNSYADVLQALNEDDPPQRVEDALEEAYRIRLAALGPANLETLANQRHLAEIRGLPSRTRGDPARIEAVAETLRQVIARAPNDERLLHDSAPAAHAALARMYAQNGLVDEAREQLRIAADMTRGWDETQRCLFEAMNLARVEDLLADRAVAAGATDVRRPRGLLDCLAGPPASK
jgi:hypothetical protein